MKNQDELIAKLSTIIHAGEHVLTTETGEGQQKSLVNEIKFHDFRISALSYLGRVFSQESTYYQAFKSEVSHPTASRTRRGIGMLTSARKELSGDWLETTGGAITREEMTDMLRLARMQQDENHHVAAVIIAGAVLEKHLRNLCLAKGIKLHNDLENRAGPKKGLQLTGEAYKKKLYERQDNKDIISWLELYETAAAGKNDSVTAAQAKTMVSGVLSLLVKTRY